MGEAHQQRRWEREEVIILVVGYFSTKYLSAEEITASHWTISNFLRKREEMITGEMVSDIFRDFAGIHMQSGRIRGSDGGQYSKWRPGRSHERRKSYRVLFSDVGLP